MKQALKLVRDSMYDRVKVEEVFELSVLVAVFFITLLAIAPII